MKCKNCNTNMPFYNETEGYEYFSYKCEACGYQIRSEITQYLVNRNAYGKYIKRIRIEKQKGTWEEYTRKFIMENGL